MKENNVVSMKEQKVNHFIKSASEYRYGTKNKYKGILTSEERNELLDQLIEQQKQDMEGK